MSFLKLIDYYLFFCLFLMPLVVFEICKTFTKKKETIIGFASIEPEKLWTVGHAYFLKSVMCLQSNVVQQDYLLWHCNVRNLLSNFIHFVILCFFITAEWKVFGRKIVRNSDVFVINK